MGARDGQRRASNVERRASVSGSVDREGSSNAGTWGWLRKRTQSRRGNPGVTFLRCALAGVFRDGTKAVCAGQSQMAPPFRAARGPSPHTVIQPCLLVPQRPSRDSEANCHVGAKCRVLWCWCTPLLSPGVVQSVVFGTASVARRTLSRPAKANTTHASSRRQEVLTGGEGVCPARRPQLKRPGRHRPESPKFTQSLRSSTITRGV